MELALKYQILSNKTSFYCLLQENNLSDEDLLSKKYKEIENIPPMDYLCKFGVKSLSGIFIELDYNSSYTILEIKKQIENKINLPISEKRLIFNGKQLEDEYTLSYYKIPYYGILHLLLRPKGAGPETKIKILYNDEEKFIYILKEEYHNLGETIIKMIKNIFKKIGINNNLNKYDFYVDETILLEEDFDKLYHKYFYFGDKTLKIYNKEKMNISKEDKIILKQRMNGLWKIEDSILSLINFNQEKWKKCLNDNRNIIKEIINKDISDEVIFNLIILIYIIKISNGKNRFKYIIKKAINGLNKIYNEINEEKIYLLKEKIYL